MGFGHDKVRTNVEGDRLSCLPDDLIHKILSFIGIKCAIETSFLSSRWRFVWTSMPYLNFSSGDFLTLPKFSKFVTRVLSHRNNQIEVSSVKLSFRGKVSQVFVKKIMTYAFSHNVQQLTVTCSLKPQSHFPLSLFSSQCLKHLSLTNSFNACSITPTSTWHLPALTTLYVSYVTLYGDNTDKCVGLFSKCANLKNLTLNHCSMLGSNGFSICHPRLSNLTLENVSWTQKVVNVVAPQLENLTIINCSGEHLISAPDLASLLYKGHYPLQLSTDGFRSLEKVDLCFYSLYAADARKIDGLLQQLHSAKFLTLNLELVEFLSSSAELISHQPSPFANLKNLKVYPLYLEVPAHKKVTMSTEVRNYLLDNSPSATFTMVSREEIRAVKNAKRAQNLISELQVLLEQGKANSKTNGARIRRGKAPMESHKAEMQVQHEQGKAEIENQRAQQETKKLGGRMAQIKSYWEGLEVQIGQGKSKTNDIRSRLLEIEVLLAKLPTWQKTDMQAQFPRLCAEADTLMKNIIDHTKFQCDEKRRCLNVYFRELATASQPSS